MSECCSTSCSKETTCKASIQCGVLVSTHHDMVCAAAGSVGISDDFTSVKPTACPCVGVQCHSELQCSS